MTDIETQRLKSSKKGKEENFIYFFNRDLYRLLIKNRLLLTDVAYDDIDWETRKKLSEVALIVWKCFDR